MRPLRFPVGARGAVHAVRGTATDAVPDELADAACRKSSYGRARSKLYFVIASAPYREVAH